MKESMKTIRLLTWFTQLGLSAAVPLLLCIGGAVWLRDRFSLGGWVIAAGVVLGVCGAVSGFRSSLRAMERDAGDGEDKTPPVSFNDHI